MYISLNWARWVVGVHWFYWPGKWDVCFFLGPISVYIVGKR